MTCLRFFYGTFLRVGIYALLIFLFEKCGISHIGLVGLVIVLFLKTVQLVAGTIWIWREGEDAAKYFTEEEKVPKVDLNPKQKRDGLKRIVWARFRESEPKCAIFGVGDRVIRELTDNISKLAGLPSTCLGKLLWFLRDAFFRFNTLTFFASMVLVVTASPVAAESPDDSRTGFRIIIAVFMLIMCFVMATEMLIGNVLMGESYTRFFHFNFEEYPDLPSPNKARLGSLNNFSMLALTTLVVIAAVCSSYYIMFDGFSGVKPPQTKTTEWGRVYENVKLWVEFFYFATTTFSTVGFGDIAPTDVSPRVLVTLVHFLTFGYVLFLLQILQSQQRSEPLPVPPLNGPAHP